MPTEIDVIERELINFAPTAIDLGRTPRGSAQHLQLEAETD